MSVQERGPAALDGDGAARRRLAAALLARRSAPAPLAPNQERLFVLQQLDPRSTAYTETVVLRLHGPLDAEALVRAVHALPGRHEWLRSRVEDGLDGPLQVPDAGLVARVDRVDLSARPGGPGGTGGPGTAADGWLAALVDEPFDLVAGPVWRAGLAALGDDDHLLVLAVHHVACDATSLAVLVEEVGDRYDALVTGEGYEGARTPSPRDLARDVRALQSSPAAREAVQRHADALEGADLDARWPGRGGATVDDPAGAPDPAGAGAPARTATVQRRVPAPVVRRLRRLAAEHGLTPFALVTAAVAAGLADSLRVGSPVLGVPVDLRAHLPGSEEVVAFLVETVAVAVPDVADGTLLRAAALVRDTVTDGLARPPRFEDVVGELRARGALPPSGSPVQAYVTWLDGVETPTLGEHGPAVVHVDRPLVDAKADTAWTAVERGDALDLRLEHDRARLDRADATDLLERVLAVLAAATAAPTTPLRELELLGDADLERLRAWEGTADPPPQEDLLGHVLAGLAAPDQPVLVTGTETVTARDLVRLVDGLATALLRAGVGPGTRVAVPAHRVPGTVVALLAVLRAGGTYLPLDPAHPPARQRSLARAARVGAVVGAAGWAAPLADDLGVPAVATDRLGHPAAAPGDPGSGTVPWPVRDPRDLAYVMFTSGSTGTPKAVRVHDAAVVARVESYRHVLPGNGRRFLLQSSLTFDASTFLFWVLATGGCLVLAGDSQAADPVELVALVAGHGVTDAFFVPPVLEAVLRVAPPGALAGLRRVLVGGDVLPPEVARLHHDLLPGAELHNMYGPTEAVVSAVSTPVSPQDATTGRSVPVGRPHPGTTVRVLEPAGRRVPVGAVGELHLGGPAVADGYDRGDAPVPPAGPFSVRAEPRAASPVAWYATGDLVRWCADGRLEHVGRGDRQVKLRGQRVELDEVEAAARALPGVAEAAVELVGQGDGRRLVAVLAPRAAAEGARAALAAVLPEAWLPDVVVGLPTLPRGASGKLDRAALRDPRRLPGLSGLHGVAGAPGAPGAGGPVDGGGRRGAGGSDVTPEGSLYERTVLSVVQGLLGTSEVGLDDDFFAAGGNSLLAARLVGQLSTVLGVTVPLHELAGGSSARQVAALAEEVAGRRAAAPQDESRMVPVRRGGSLPPVVLVARDGATSLVLLHVLSRLEQDRPVWALLRALPPPGMQAPDLVHDGAEAAAVLAAQLPGGTVHVVGHSASGLVAVECARALGDRVGSLVLLDTVPPASWADPVARLRDTARVLVRAFRMRRLLRVAGPRGLDPAAVRSLRTYQETVASHRTRVRPVDVPVTLLASAEAREAQGRDDLGWGRLAREVTTVPVDGDHHQLLLQPHVDRTAELLVAVFRG